MKPLSPGALGMPAFLMLPERKSWQERLPKQ